MVDPISVAGLALGAASLAFELFSGCVKGYNLLLAASEMPEACRYLLVRLQMEKEKQIGWAVLAGVSEDENTLITSLKLNRLTIIDALREMQVLLLDVQKLEERYNLRLVADEGETNASPHEIPQQAFPDQHFRLEERAMRLFDKTRKFPKRLKWTAFRKDKFEELLDNIVSLNDSMMRFLEAHDREKHFKMQEMTLMQILQVNNRMDDLFQLVKSLRAMGATSRKRRVASGLSSIDEETGSEKYEGRAVRLTRFKAMRLAIETEQTWRLPDSDPASQAAELSIDKLKLASTADKVRGDREQRSSGTFDGSQVWVEWKYYEPALVDDDHSTDGEEHQPPGFVENRISKLAKLLQDPEKPPEFRVPDCLGYVRDLKECRLGIIFMLDGPSEPGLPISLLELLSSLSKPSLTTRIKIAGLVSSSIWYLHSTQWLHKGLRSENIVFQSRKAFFAPLPLLCGFDYSRPVNVDETTTERPLENLWHDLYRHPGTQFDSPREGRHGFRGLYDVYSLGVILAEIGLWRPVHAILDIDSSQRLRAATVKGTREVLLHQDKLDLLESEAGVVFASVVKACLSGDLASNKAPAAEGDSRLQLDVWEKVVEPLEGIAV